MTIKRMDHVSVDGADEVDVVGVVELPLAGGVVEAPPADKGKHPWRSGKICPRDG